MDNNNTYVPVLTFKIHHFILMNEFYFFLLNFLPLQTFGFFCYRVSITLGLLSTNFTISMFLRNAYVAEVSKISYGNTKLSLNGLDNGHVIFDSGSSYTYFTKQAYADLVTTVSSYLFMSLVG